MNVPFFEPVRQHKKYLDRLNAIFTDTIISGNYILGDYVSDFENNAAKYLNVDKFIGCSSGTDALQMIFYTIYNDPSKEVLVPNFTFISSASSPGRAGHKIKLVDVSKDSFLVDPKYLMEQADENTSAIVYVHLFGHYTDLTELSEFCRQRKIILVEDSAQGFDSNLGLKGDFGAYSFFPAKNLGAIGDAGGVSLNYSKVLRYHDDLLLGARQHGMDVFRGKTKKYQYAAIGGNFRIDTLQARLLNFYLDKVDDFNNKRREHAKKYYDAFNTLDIVLPPYHEKNSYNQFSILIKDRDNFKKYLLDNGIETQVYYPAPLSSYSIIHSFFKNIKKSTFITCPNSYKISNEIISLPISHLMYANEQDYVIDKVLDWFKK